MWQIHDHNRQVESETDHLIIKSRSTNFFDFFIRARSKCPIEVIPRPIHKVAGVKAVPMRHMIIILNMINLVMLLPAIQASMVSVLPVARALLVMNIMV
jgi:hypothetical protein